MRSAAAAGDTFARTTARPDSASGGDASRDALTLDLFGDPVLEPVERAPVASRDEVVEETDAATGAAEDAAAGMQATLDGFSAPEGATAVGPAETGRAVPADGAGEAAIADRLPAADGAATKADDAPLVDAAAMAAIERHAAGGEVAAPVLAATAGATAVKSRGGRPPGDAVKERRASFGGRRRAAAGASEAVAPMRSEPVATHVDTVPEATESKPSAAAAAPIGVQTPGRPAQPAIAMQAAPPRDAAPQPDTRPSPVAQPVASAASFVTRPSSERTQPAAPAFDPDTHLRPLTDRLAALQSDVDGLTGSADREMRRVNRLLLALAVVVLAGLVALVLQTRQIAHLKQDVAAKQQRIDRLAADLSTQQATLMTLEEHHEALLSQVDRLQRNANRDAAVAKRGRRTR